MCHVEVVCCSGEVKKSYCHGNQTTRAIVWLCGALNCNAITKQSRVCLNITSNRWNLRSTHAHTPLCVGTNQLRVFLAASRRSRGMQALGWLAQAKCLSGKTLLADPGLSSHTSYQSAARLLLLFHTSGWGSSVWRRLTTNRRSHQLTLIAVGVEMRVGDWVSMLVRCFSCCVRARFPARGESFRDLFWILCFD